MTDFGCLKSEMGKYRLADDELTLNTQKYLFFPNDINAFNFYIN